MRREHRGGYVDVRHDFGEGLMVPAIGRLTRTDLARGESAREGGDLGRRWDLGVIAKPLSRAVARAWQRLSYLRRSLEVSPPPLGGRGLYGVPTWLKGPVNACAVTAAHVRPTHDR